jgi:uncharacterized membrane protein
MSNGHPGPLSWRYSANQHRHPANLALRLISAPLLLLSLPLLLIGFWQAGFVPLSLGAIGLYAALAIELHGRHLERK